MIFLSQLEWMLTVCVPRQNYEVPIVCLKLMKTFQRAFSKSSIMDSRANQGRVNKKSPYLPRGWKYDRYCLFLDFVTKWKFSHQFCFAQNQQFFGSYSSGSTPDGFFLNFLKFRILGQKMEIKKLHSSLTVVRLALVRTWRSTSLSPTPSVCRAYKLNIFLAKLTPAEGHVSEV